MKTVLFALFLSLFTVAKLHAADPAQAVSDPKMEEMMKMMKEAATPGAPHKILEGMAGKWKYTSKWWSNPEAKPEESTGTGSMKMILGGRWLQQDIKGKAMGMPFMGMGMTGYDNVKGKYESLWFDTMSTGVMHGTGTYNEATKTLEDSGTFSDPTTKTKNRNYRGEWKIVDKNTMVYSMFGTTGEDTKEFKQMEMTFKRAK